MLCDSATLHSINSGIGLEINYILSLKCWPNIMYSCNAIRIPKGYYQDTVRIFLTYSQDTIMITLKVYSLHANRFNFSRNCYIMNEDVA